MFQLFLGTNLNLLDFSETRSKLSASEPYKIVYIVTITEA
jgi:hypothetical protein